MASFKNSKEENSGNYRPISPTSASRKIMDHIFLEAISKDRKVTENTQHRYAMGRLCLTRLTTFCGKQMKEVQWVIFVL